VQVRQGGPVGLEPTTCGLKVLYRPTGDLRERHGNML